MCSKAKREKNKKKNPENIVFLELLALLAGFDLCCGAGHGHGSECPLGIHSLSCPFESSPGRPKNQSGALGGALIRLASPAGFEPTAFRLGAHEAYVK